jgi:hypothetical protein
MRARFIGSGNVAGRRPLAASFSPAFVSGAPGPPAVGRNLIFPIKDKLRKIVILLIGGTSCTGKTKTAYELMKRIGIPYLSVDILMMGIYRSNTNCGFSPMSSSTEISKHIWPIVLEMIKTNIENESNYIFEGFQILPINVMDIPNSYLEKTKAYFFGFSEYYVENKYDEIKRNRSIIEKGASGFRV